MDIQYKLFKNKMGVILERTPKRFFGSVHFQFENAGDNLTAIFKDRDGNVLYRALENSACSAPLSFFAGEITVIVVDLNNSMSVKYKCEGLICQKDKDSVWIMPEGIDLPLEIIEAQNQIEELRSELKKAFSEIAILKEAYQGYDVI